MQVSFILELFKLCKENGIHTALDTSGFIFNDHVKEVLEYTDLVLLDIKHIDKDMYKKITSVDLEPTLKFIQYLQEINKPVWLRYVLLPGYTDDIKDLNDWAKYVSQFDVVKRVDILPFHQMAIYKWEKTNREYKLKDVSTPTKEQIQKAEEIFNKYDLPLYKERS
jgi:pyruvate formate-lyase activating enzyme